MTFANPQYLWLLPAVPPVMAVFFWWSWRVRRRLMTQFIHERLLQNLVAGASPARQKIRAGCLIMAVVCLIFALAQPRWGYDLEEVAQRGLDIVVAIDTSKSMLAEDIAPNRLARAKLAALDLMQQAKSDRLGLVAFAGTAFLQCPLTVDDTAFRQSVEALDVTTIPEGGTALSEAIETASKAFKEGHNYKVLVLFTDGEDHDSDPLEAAKTAAKEGLRIFTVGIGSVEGELLRTKGAGGQPDYIRDENGDVVKSRLNQSLLEQIAGAANGFYLPLKGAKTIDTLYQSGLAPLPKSESKGKWVKRAQERYQWPLALALILLVVEMCLPERAAERERKKPAGPARAALTHAAVVLLALAPVAGRSSPAEALREYNRGRFGAALKEYQRLALQNTNDLRLVFNAGVAAYAVTNFDEAAKDFNLASASPDLKLQQSAYYNLGNTQYRLGELKFEPTAEGLDTLETAWKEACRSYTIATNLDRGDADASHNLNFVKRQMEMLAGLREAMRLAKQAADEAVRRAEFHRALQIMESLDNPIATKKFQDYVKKLKDIDEIVTPAQH